MKKKVTMALAAAMAFSGILTGCGGTDTIAEETPGKVLVQTENGMAETSGAGKYRKCGWKRKYRKWREGRKHRRYIGISGGLYDFRYQLRWSDCRLPGP